MIEIGVGSCQVSVSLEILRSKKQTDLAGCKATCLADKECSFISYTSPSASGTPQPIVQIFGFPEKEEDEDKDEEEEEGASSCILFAGILCHLDPEDASSFTYGKPAWLDQNL